MQPGDPVSTPAHAAVATTATAVAPAPVDKTDDKPQTPNNTESDDEEFPARKNSANEREIAIALSAKEAPLPYDDEAPPLPDEAPPEDDGWDARWDTNASCWYFYNRFTGKSQWENPRQPEATAQYNGPYDRFANNFSPCHLLSYPNPCLSQIREQLHYCSPQHWRTWYFIPA